MLLCVVINLKGQFTQTNDNSVITHSLGLFQICMTFFPQWNLKEDGLQDVHTALLYTMKVNEDWSCQAPKVTKKKSI